MAEHENKSGSDPGSANSRNALTVIFASAMEAFGSALVLWILGGVAISIAGGFASGMIPSLPPGFGKPQPAGGRPAGHPHGQWHGGGETAFILFFAIFFAHSLWKGFHDGERQGGRRVLRILANLRAHWFRLIVGNAISAWFAVLVLGIIQAFSPWQMLWHWVWGLVFSVIQVIAQFIFGTRLLEGPGGWISWYNANQTKLNFWIVYLAGAFDDLGVPNLKTLARWSWRRMQKRKNPALPVMASPEDAA